MKQKLFSKATEQSLPESENLSELSALEIVDLMTDQDLMPQRAVLREKKKIATVVEAIEKSFRQGGKLFYLGAGTSGRLGMLDAAECPPTFRSEPERVQAVMAGGFEAFARAVESAEDDPDACRKELMERGLEPADVVVGISASGRTPFVLSGLEYAKSLGCFTASICCNRDNPTEPIVEVAILLEVGPEVLTGSTRLKSATATKMVLNQLTTGAFVRWGRTVGNLMASLNPSCEKLRHRSVEILRRRFPELSESELVSLLEGAQGDMKVAIVMQTNGLSQEQAKDRLARCDGDLNQAMMAT